MAQLAIINCRVAEAAGVSVAYLYKYEELKERIDHLKAQQEKVSKPVQPQPASDKSKQVIIAQMRERIKKLEAENRGLRDQNEAIYGWFCQLQGVQQHVEVLRTQNASLKAENDWLKQQLEQTRPSSQNTILSTPIPNSKVTPLEKKRSGSSGISDQIQAALDGVGLKLNPTLAKTIQAVPEETVVAAIDALEEAMTAGEIERPGGWLKRAIEECWKPNEPIHQQSETKQSNTFGQWFDLARARGLVVASIKGEDGQMYVFDRKRARYPVKQMLAKYLLETLKS